MLTNLAVSATTLLSTASSSEKVDLTGSWNTLVSALSGGNVDKLLQFLSIAGVILVVVAVGGYLFQRRRGGGGNTQGLLWAALAGALLAGPKFFIPLILTLADFAVNGIGNIIGNLT
ncbi:hypothetical protein [Curtobacterium sp. MCSS17_016]|uniref:hypothetical protein n=1 Tax=Curtobacterium sp. MCSS17_016 TaxID=2175644 RepID=UPI000DA73B37|nr:hypothetical protein [Curtobacterium sp. MCSS17_016]WIE80971.1 hypothetical protein DEJ19_020860 [Curtobacterium sp. MCSS17_016]